METIKKACDEYLEYLESDDYNEDGRSNYESAIFEAAMEWAFGDKIWDRINKCFE